MADKIYEVNARILNHIARKDIPLSDVGRQLVNMFTHVLMTYENLADVIPEPHASELRELNLKNEEFPANLISLVNPERSEHLDIED